MKNLLLLLLISICSIQLAAAQKLYEIPAFDRQDSLRGSITKERVWWDLTYYHLQVDVDIANKFLKGKNLVQYKVLDPHKKMQIDLQPPMKITKVVQNGKDLKFTRDGNAWFIDLKENQKQDEIKQLEISFEGKPKVAVRPPWDGGITWQQDSAGKPFVATSNQGIGASIWWPNKDHPYDEVDSMLISITVPDTLMDVSNGRLRKVEDNNDGTKTWNWFVSNPINSYGVNINIADYAHFSDVYSGEKGELDLNYYVLPENLEEAKEQFQQAKMMLEAFEYWFGPYPFYEDGFKLVEVPYLGMEHQSSVTYGNGYKNGYLGRDLSGSGWGLKFDFIIIHEAAHEWFANNITNADVADMWLHEGFTNNAENLFVDYHFGTEAAGEYVRGLRLGISNDRPIQGIYDLDYRGSGDMYNKGGNLLHTIRQIADNDSLWRETLRGLNKTFYHQTVKTEQVEEYISQKLGIDLRPVFNQYVRDIRIPVLEYAFRDGSFMYRWGNVIDDFKMPVDVILNGKEIRLEAEKNWKRMQINSQDESLIIDPNYYVGSFNLLGEK